MPGKADTAAAIPVVGVVSGGGNAGVDRVGKGRQHRQQAERAGADRDTGAEAFGIFQIFGPPQAAAGTESPHRRAHRQRRRKPQPREQKRLGRIGGNAGQGIVKGIPDVLAVVGGGGQRQAGNAAGIVQHPAPAARRPHRHVPAAAGQFNGVGLVGSRDNDGEQRVLRGLPLRGGAVVEGQPLQLQVVDGKVHAGKMQRRALAGKGHAAVVAAGCGLVQVVEQLDGHIVVGGKVLDVAQKHLKGQRAQYQRRRGQRPAPCPPQQAGAAQRADAPRRRGRRGADRAQPEQAKIHQQARLAKKQEGPRPHAGKHRPGGGKVPAGRAAAGQAGGQHPKRQAEDGTEQQRGKRHRKCTPLQGKYGGEKYKPDNYK